MPLTLTIMPDEIFSKVMLTNHIIDSDKFSTLRTSRATGSSVVSHESPTDSPKAPSISLSWLAYSFRNWPYFFNWTLPAISVIKKVCFYSAVSIPFDHSKRFTLFALPDRTVHSDTNSASPGSILAMQQICAKTKSLTFPPLSIPVARYSFIQLSQQGRQWRERKCPIFETLKKSN